MMNSSKLILHKYSGQAVRNITSSFSLGFLMLLIFAFSQLESFSQIIAGQSTEGIFIYFENEIPKGENLKIMRTSQNGSSQEVHDISISKSLKEFRRRQANVPATVSGLVDISDDLAHEMMKSITTAKSFSDIQFGNLPDVQAALGFAHWDQSIKENEVYTYSLNTSGEKSASIKYSAEVFLESGVKSFSGTLYEEDPKATFYAIKGDKEKALSFLAYRSTPYTLSYDKIPAIKGKQISNDTLFYFFRDTSIVKTGVYHYSIRTIDKFGRLSLPSEFVEASNFPVQSSPFIERIEAFGSNEAPKITIRWNMKNSAMLRELRIFKAESYDGPYHQIAILSPADTSYTDLVQQTGESYFYYLQGEEIISGNTINSAKVTHLSTYKVKSYPPEILGLESEDGNVKVSWSAFSGNEIGFKVYRSDGNKEELLLISEFIAKQNDSPLYEYIDSNLPKNKSKSYGYTVRSIGSGFSESENSEIFYVQTNTKKDIDAPYGLSGRGMDDGSFHLSWTNMLDHVEKLLGYNVYRMRAGEFEFTQVNKEILSSGENFIRLGDIQAGDSYHIKALDLFGNVSPASNSFSPEIAAAEKFNIGHLTLTDSNEGIIIKWKANLDEKRIYTLLKKDDKGAISEIAILDINTGKYLDNATLKNKRYIYMLKASNENGDMYTTVVSIVKEI